MMPPPGYRFQTETRMMLLHPVDVLKAKELVLGTSTHNSHQQVEAVNFMLSKKNWMITATTANIISAAEAQISLLALPLNAAGVGDCVRTPGGCTECVRAVSRIASGHNAQRLVGIKCETLMIYEKSRGR